MNASQRRSLGLLGALVFSLALWLLAIAAFGQGLYPNQLGGSSGPLGGGGSGPSCSNALDFSASCNSQYLSLLGL